MDRDSIASVHVDELHFADGVLVRQARAGRRPYGAVAEAELALVAPVGAHKPNLADGGVGITRIRGYRPGDHRAVGRPSRLVVVGRVSQPDDSAALRGHDIDVRPRERRRRRGRIPPAVGDACPVGRPGGREGRRIVASELPRRCAFQVGAPDAANTFVDPVPCCKRSAVGRPAVIVDPAVETPKLAVAERIQPDFQPPITVPARLERDLALRRRPRVDASRREPALVCPSEIDEKDCPAPEECERPPVDGPTRRAVRKAVALAECKVAVGDWLEQGSVAVDLRRLGAAGRNIVSQQ